MLGVILVREVCESTSKKGKKVSSFSDSILVLRKCNQFK